MSADVPSQLPPPNAAWPTPMPAALPPAVARPLRGRAKIASIALAVIGVLALACAVVLMRQAADVNGMDPARWNGENPYQDDELVARSWSGPLGLELLGAAAFIPWFYRARTNIEALSPGPRTLGKGWAVGGWIVPLGMAVLPAIVAHDIWKGSVSEQTAHEGRPRARHLLLWGWWLTFAAASFLYGRSLTGHTSPDKVREGKATAAELLDGAHRSFVMASFGLVLTAVAAAFAIAVIHRITAMQARLMED
ncbi:DUF4328 domain-containing protein [Yinghuangia seranimata]|uniref:DUF4328 domain-containing protein n=1 Tax=Yinghuangia seranimata TaxID=408067 RepID=UPI00248BDBB3|nr:DUF4328 domain-containing protein [Yinghuangia seranimata]MDI2124529.1 DUF4328 domain-containing protein [Yinghuangia seranimata]